MKMPILFTALFFLALTPVLSAQDTWSGEKSGEIDGQNLEQIDITLDSGFDVQIRGTDAGRITYTYTFEGNRLAHERNFVRAGISLEKQGSTAELAIRFPELDELQNRQNTGWLQQLLGRDNRQLITEKQDLVIEVPADVILRFTSRYSNLDLAGVQKDVMITNRSGTVTVANLGGNLRVQNEYGNTSAENITGDIQVESRSSDITLHDIGGSARVSSLYSNLTISEVGGDLQIQTQSGEVETSDVGGMLRVHGDYTKMNIARVEGPVHVTSRSGELTVRETGDLQFEGEYTGIDARQLNGENGVRIKNRSGNIFLAGIEGPAAISGEYLEIELVDIRQALTVENRSGSVKGRRLAEDVRIQGEYNQIDLIDFSGSRLQISNRSSDVNVQSTGTLTSVDIQVQYGDVLFTMTEDYEGRYSLQTRYGEISSDLFPMETADRITTTSEGGRSSDPKAVSGTLGSNDRNRFVIHAENGNITIRN